MEMDRLDSSPKMIPNQKTTRYILKVRALNKVGESL